MENIGKGDSYHDFMFVNEAINDDFSQLQIVESRYRWQAGAVGGYKQLLQQADSRIDWRYRIARWMLRVADDFLLKRDTALIALNYFDRMMMSQRTLQRDQFQVAAIACLFISSKLFQKKPLKVNSLILYTKNAFQREDILAMEEELLRAHASFFYPITSSTFVSILLKDLNESAATITSVIESCQFMIELAACDLFFIAHRASTIAVAAIVVTLEINTKVAPEAVTVCLSNIKAMIDYTIDADAQECINKLRSVHNHNAQRIKDMEEKSADDEVAKYAKGKEADPDASRIATPSPTDPCQRISDTPSPPIIVDEEYSTASRKRQRRTSPPSTTEIEII